MAETFLSPVIEKLLDLIVEDANSLKGVHRDVKSLQKELEIIEPFLRDAEAKSGRGELNDASKVWLKQLREEAERIEDVVDEYLYNVQQLRHEDGFVGYLRRAGGSIKSFSWRRNMASEIGDIKESLREIKERGQSYGLRPFEQAGGSSSSAAAVDPRIGSRFVDDDELVGIDSMSKELVTSLVEGPSVRSVISFVGEGGIGKTTLANKVYKDVVAKGHFDCHVWITVSQSCNMETILKNMTKKICPTTQQPAGGETVTIEELISVLRDSLATKRYMVVFDDVWQTEFWGVIKHALPYNVNGSRIILTTRNASVVESFKETSDDVVHELKTWSHQQAWELFCKKAFSCSEIKGCCPPELEQLSREILSKCQGLPLAIVVVAGLLSKKEKSQVEWQKVLDNLSREFEGNYKLSNISKVLLLSYHDLPYHLKLCFLYFGIFPEDCSIYAHRLYNLWIAEGFIKSRRNNISLEHCAAEEYLNELINRNLVSYEVSYGTDKLCKVHDLFHELIRTRIDDCCFCHVFNEHKFGLNGWSRRLSNYGNIKNALNATRESKIRSIFLFDVDELTDSVLIDLFENFNLLKVLDFRYAPLHKLPKEVGSLFNLNYLDLRGTNVEMLPKSIGKLHNLQTLDVSFTLVRELPIEINKLRNLRHLIADSMDEENELSMYSYCGVKIHEGIERLEDLQTLTRVEAYSSGVGFVKELYKLRQLRYLSILKVTAEMVKALGNSIENMNHLDQLYLTAINEDEVLDLDCNISSPPTLLLSLSLICRLRQIPSWISKLQNLQSLELNFSRLIDEPLKYLKGLPNIAYLCLHQAYDGEELHFEDGSFPKLKQLELEKLEALKVLKIDTGALPLLEKLNFGPSPLMMEMPSNIQHLRNLRSLHIIDMSREFVIALQPNGGTDHWKIQNIPLVEFWYYTGRGLSYNSYKLGSSELVKHLEEQANRSTPT